jgi:hypothetical protein
VLGLPILILASAQTASTAAPGPTESDAAAPAAAAGENVPCETPYPGENDQEVVICVERQQGFRIDPDILNAEKERKRQKLKRPERFVDKSCNSVGPMGCGGGGVDLLAVAIGAATIAKRAVSGENVGEMFVADKDPNGYELYKQAKREREAKRAAEAEALKKEAEEREAAAETAATPD